MGRPTKAEQNQIAERRTKAIEARVNGATWKKVAELCGYSSGAAAAKDVRRALEQQHRRQDEAADALRAQKALQTLGDEVGEAVPDVDPYVHMLRSIWRSSAMVGALEIEVAELDRQQWVNGVTKTVQMPDGSRRIEAEAKANTALVLYGQWLDRLATVSRMAAEAGVNDRLVRIEEDKGRLIAEWFQKVIDDPELGLDEEVRTGLRVVAARELRALPGGAA